MKEKEKSILKTIFWSVIVVLIAFLMFLTIRMIVIKDDFFAPFNKEPILENENVDINKEIEYIEENKEYIEELEGKENVKHYSGEIQFSDYLETAEKLDFTKYIKTNIDVFVENETVVKISFQYDLSNFLDKSYNRYKKEIQTSSYETYEEFSKTIMDVFAMSFVNGFTGETAEKTEDNLKQLEKDGIFENEKIKVFYPKSGKIMINFKEAGIDDIYKNFELEKGKSSKLFLEKIEKAYVTKLKEVKKI